MGIGVEGEGAAGGVSSVRVQGCGFDGFRKMRAGGALGVTQSLQNPVIKEYALNHIRDPIMI